MQTNQEIAIAQARQQIALSLFEINLMQFAIMVDG